MPNFEEYYNRRAKHALEKSGFDRVVLIYEGMLIIKNIHHCFVHDLGEQHLLNQIGTLLGLDAYEGILAIAYLLNDPECNYQHKFNRLTINSLFAKASFGEDDEELFNAFVTIFKCIKVLFLKDITLTDGLMDCILEAKRRAGQDCQLQIIPSQLILSHAQLINYIDLLPSSFSLTPIASSTYRLGDTEGANQLSICRDESYNLLLTSQQLQDILAARQGRFKQLSLVRLSDFSLEVKDEHIEEVSIGGGVVIDSPMCTDDKLPRFLRGFKNLARLAFDDISFTRNTPEVTQNFFAIIGKLEELIVLELTRLDLNDEVINNIFQVINTHSLLILNIRNHDDFVGIRLTPDSFKKLVDAIRDNLHLKDLFYRIPNEYIGHPLVRETTARLEKYLSRNNDIPACEKLRSEALSICDEAKQANVFYYDTPLDQLISLNKAGLVALYEKTLKAKEIALNLREICYPSERSAQELISLINEILVSIRKLLIPAMKRELDQHPSLSVLEVPSAQLDDDHVLDRVVIPYVARNETLKSIYLGDNFFTEAALTRLADGIRESNLSITLVVTSNTSNAKSKAFQEISVVLQRNFNRNELAEKRTNAEQELSKGYTFLVPPDMKGWRLTLTKLLSVYVSVGELRRISYPDTMVAEHQLIRIKGRLAGFTSELFESVGRVAAKQRIEFHSEIIAHLSSLGLICTDDTGSEFWRRELLSFYLPLLRTYIENYFEKLVKLEQEGPSVGVIAFLLQLQDIAKKLMKFSNLYDGFIQLYTDAYLRSLVTDFDIYHEVVVAKLISTIPYEFADLFFHYEAVNACKYPYPQAFLRNLHHVSRDMDGPQQEIVNNHFVSCLLYANADGQKFSHRLKVHAQLLSLLLDEKNLCEASFLLNTSNPTVIANLLRGQDGLLTRYLHVHVNGIIANVPPQEYANVYNFLYKLYESLTVHKDLRSHAYKMLTIILDFIAVGLNEANLEIEVFKLKEMARKLNLRERQLFTKDLILRLTAVNSFAVLSYALTEGKSIPLIIDSCCMAYNRFVQSEIAAHRLTRRDALIVVKKLNEMMASGSVITRAIVSKSREVLYSVLDYLQQNSLKPSDIDANDEVDFKSKRKDYLRTILVHSRVDELDRKALESLFEVYRDMIINILSGDSQNEEVLLLKNIRVSTACNHLLNRLNEYLKDKSWIAKQFGATAKLAAIKDEIAEVIQRYSSILQSAPRHEYPSNAVDSSVGLSVQSAPRHEHPSEAVDGAVGFSVLQLQPIPVAPSAVKAAPSNLFATAVASDVVDEPLPPLVLQPVPSVKPTASKKPAPPEVVRSDAQLVARGDLIASSSAQQLSLAATSATSSKAEPAAQQVAVAKSAALVVFPNGRYSSVVNAIAKAPAIPKPAPSTALPNGQYSSVVSALDQAPAVPTSDLTVKLTY